MGEDALRLQPRQGAGVRDGGDARLKMLPPHQPAHAGIHLDVDLQRPAESRGRGAVLLRLGLGGDGLGDAVGDKLRHHGGRGMSQDEDGQAHALPPELPGLVQTGDRQVVRPQLLQLPGDLHRPVAVGVRLHHAQVPDAGPGLSPGLMVVVGQGVQVDLRPGPLQNSILHRGQSPFLAPAARDPPGLPVTPGVRPCSPLLYHKFSQR